MDIVTVLEGASPLVLAQPHSGTHIPAAIFERLNERGRAMADTDWHVDRLYDGLMPDASVVRANFHRYVIDANRPPDGASLYPGQNTTGLCPLTDFDGAPIYRDGAAPDAREIEQRRLDWHAPYHAALKSAIARAKLKFGYAVLYDCHSIRSAIPYLFDGDLPTFNIGTNNGATCTRAIESAAGEACAEASREGGYSFILNGRFKGGWTTRHYGRPNEAEYAIQMELAQRAYMTEAPPWDFDEAKAERLRAHLARILHAIVDAAPPQAEPLEAD